MASRPKAKIRPRTANVSDSGVPQLRSAVVRGSKSRDRLITVASNFFLSGSFHGVGTAEICAAANVNKGSFYHFFPSKTDLLLEVIELRVQEVETRFKRIISSRTSAERKVLQLFTIPNDKLGEFKREATTAGYFLGNIILELASSDPRVQTAATAALQRWTSVIETLVVSFLEEENISNLDAHDAAVAIVGLLQGGAVVASGYGDPRKLRAFGHIALTILRQS